MTSISNPTVAIIGAGPAGLMAAEVLAQGGAAVTVYDAMPSAGRKFLMAGRGGLNLTHSEPLPAFLARYGERDAASRSRHRRVSAAGAARLERGAGAADLRRFQRPGLPESVQGLAAAAGVAAAAGLAAACGSRCAIAGPAGTTTGVCCFKRPDGQRDDRGQRDRAGARRRKLAAARLRWRMGGNARRQGRDDIAAAAGQLRLHRRLVRYLSRPLRGPAAQGRCAVVRRAHRARRSHRYAQRVSKAARSMRCRRDLREAIPECRGRRRCTSRCGPISTRANLTRGWRRHGASSRCRISCARPRICRRSRSDCCRRRRWRPACRWRRCRRPISPRLINAVPVKLDRRRPDRARDLDRGRHRLRRTRCRLHDPPLARRVRRRRNARLGSADRRLSAAGLVRDRRGGG